MNTKNTSGPWSFSTPSGDVFADEKLVASVYGDDPECKPDDRLRANARLIAAAPDLLEACKVARDSLAAAIKASWEGATDQDVSQNLVIKRLDAAIAKATGEAA